MVQINSEGLNLNEEDKKLLAQSYRSRSSEKDTYHIGRRPFDHVTSRR